MSGVAKNAIDWLSPAGRHSARVRRQARRHRGRVPRRLRHHSRAGRLAAGFKTLGADLYSRGRLLVSRAGTLVDANGEITDAATRDNIAKFVKGS
jgi:hypothetical protein